MPLFSSSKSFSVKSLVAGSALVFISTGVALVLVEIFCRFYPSPAFDSWGARLFCKDQQDNRILVPGITGKALGIEHGDIEIRANSQGYRDTEWSAKNSPRKILMLGDSFGFGWACRFETSIPYILDKTEEYSLYNVSIPGLGMEEYFSRYGLYKNIIKPDYVLILMYVNDLFSFQDSSRLSRVFPRASDLDKFAGLTAYEPECQSVPAKNLKNILERSYLFRHLNRLRLHLGWTLGKGGATDNMLRYSYQKAVNTLKPGSRPMQDALAYLSSMLNIIREQGSNPVLVYIPPRYAVYHEGLEDMHRIFGEESKEFNPGLAEVNLDSLSRQLEVPFLNLATEIKKSSERLYFKMDGHLNEAGQTRAGETIYRFLSGLSSGDKNEI